MPRVSFSKVKLHSEKVIVCSKCNKRLKRRTHFYQTLNPFNKNASGAPKTVDEIRVELRTDEAAWLKEREACSSCGGTMRTRGVS